MVACRVKLLKSFLATGERQAPAEHLRGDTRSIADLNQNKTDYFLDQSMRFWLVIDTLLRELNYLILLQHLSMALPMLPLVTIASVTLHGQHHVH